MSKCLLFSLVLFAPYLAFAQVGIGHGRVVVINSTKDELVIATDSRIIDVEGRHEPQDSYCKIATFNHQIVFSSVGAYFFNAQLGDGLVSWNNIGLLSDVVRSSPFTADAPRIVNIANTWSDEVVKRWNQIYFIYPQIVVDSARANKGTLTGGLFAELYEGELYKVVATIMFNPAKRPPVWQQFGTITDCWPCGQNDGWSVCAGGKTEVPAEFCQRTTPRAQNEAKNWSFSKELLDRWDIHSLFAFRLADLTVAYDKSATVGGNIDVLKLDKSGTHWLARKNQCPESQN